MADNPVFSYGVFPILSCLLLGAILALFYLFTAKFLIGSKVTWWSSYTAGALGMASWLGVMTGGVIGLSAMGITNVWFAIAPPFAGLIIMSAVNGVLVRTVDGKQIGAISGFKIVALPTLLFLLYAWNSRPEEFR